MLQVTACFMTAVALVVLVSAPACAHDISPEDIVSIVVTGPPVNDTLFIQLPENVGIVIREIYGEDIVEAGISLFENGTLVLRIGTSGPYFGDNLTFKSQLGIPFEKGSTIGIKGPTLKKFTLIGYIY